MANKEIVADELERRGGTCVHPGCLATQVEWHHRDPETRLFGIGSGNGRISRARLIAELAKCDPLCRPHHDEKHPQTAERRLKSSAALSKRWADPAERERLEVARQKAVATRSARAKTRRGRSAKSALQRAANLYREGDLDLS